MSRRLAREVAFRALFQVDVGRCSAETALRHSLAEFAFTPAEVQFIRALVQGALAVLPSLDELIKKNLVRWELHRLSAVDRNLLRLALHEILNRPDIPNAVAINEALELAKKYGSSGEAVAFINGILDKIAGEALGR